MVATKTGTSGADMLYGGGPDTLVGLTGNDTYVVYLTADVVDETAEFDRDQVITFSSYALGAEARIEVLSAAVGSGTDPYYLVGNRFDQLIVGNYGNNVLNGAGGADTLIGLYGDDVYRVYGRETIVERAGEGFDIAYASGAFALGAGVSIEYLGAADQASTTAAVSLAGNELSQVVVGSNAGDRLSGGSGGNDTLIGLGGDDTYFAVSTSGTLTIVEAAGQGTDSVLVYGNFALAEGVSIEILRPADDASRTAGYSILGNGFAQRIAGADGADTLNGNGGGDTLAGGRGDDVYRVFGTGDLVIEAAGEGNDTVFTSATYGLGAAAVETLSTANQAGTEAINLFGNGYRQTLIGNAGGNLLDGGGVVGSGGDTLIGLGGNDTYRVYGNDTVTEAVGGGTDIIYTSASYAMQAFSEVEALSTLDNSGTEAINLFGNEFAQVIVGNAGVNVIDGGAGSDTLYGLGGDDFFRFSTTPSSANIRTIADFGNGADTILLDPARFGGLATGAIAASAIAYGPAATDADDRIIYDPATGALSFDADGNGAGRAEQFAILPAGLPAAAIRVAVAPIANATVSSAQAQEGSPLTFTITLDRAPILPISFSYATIPGTATPGQDYTAPSGTVSFAVGQTSATVTVNTTADAIWEPSETLQLQLTGGSQTVTGTGTILNVGGIARINSGGTFSIGGATQGTILETAYPGATGFVFGAENASMLPAAHTIAFGPTSYAPGTPTIGVSGVGGGSTIAALDFSQLGTGLVVRNGEYTTAGGASIFSLPGSRPIFNGDPRSIVGSAGNDLIDRSDASPPSILVSFSGSINGGAGNDTLIGALAQDGGAGDDRLVGILGTQMTGGSGSDTFVLPINTRTPGTNVQSSPNSLVDFTPGQDRIELVLNVSSDLALGALDPSRFAIGTATTPDQRIVYDPETGRLFYDANGSFGDLAGSVPLFARLPAHLDLSAASFTVVVPG